MENVFTFALARRAERLCMDEAREQYPYHDHFNRSRFPVLPAPAIFGPFATEEAARDTMLALTCDVHGMNLVSLGSEQPSRYRWTAICPVAGCDRCARFDLEETYVPGQTWCLYVEQIQLLVYSAHDIERIPELEALRIYPQSVAFDDPANMPYCLRHGVPLVRARYNELREYAICPTQGCTTTFCPRKGAEVPHYAVNYHARARMLRELGGGIAFPSCEAHGSITRVCADRIVCDVQGCDVPAWDRTTHVRILGTCANGHARTIVGEAFGCNVLTCSEPDTNLLNGVRTWSTQYAAAVFAADAESDEAKRLEAILCDECADYSSDTNAREYYDGGGNLTERLLCQSCADDVLADCENCCETHEKHEMESVSGDYLCTSCYEETSSCESCHNCIRDEDTRTVHRYNEGAETWCNRCARNRAYMCVSCEEYHTESGIREDEEGDVYCHSCADDGNGNFGAHGRVLAYSTNVLDHLGIYPPKGQLAFGCELEVITRSRDAVAGIWERADGSACVKSDGSLSSGGVEIVTAPLTFDKMRTTLRSLLRHGRTLDVDESCGMHVHVSRSALTYAQKARLMLWAHSGDAVQEAFLSALADRDLDGHDYARNGKRSWREAVNFFRRDVWNEAAQRYEPGAYEIRDNAEGARYCVLNTQNDETLELRLFAGTANATRAIENVESVHAVLAFLGRSQTSLRDVTNPRAFASYVLKCRKEYPAFAERFLTGDLQKYATGAEAQAVRARVQRARERAQAQAVA